ARRPVLPGRGLAAHPAAVLVVPRPEELDALDHDLVLGPLPAAVLVLPLLEDQPALDVERVARPGVLRDQLDQVPLRFRPAYGLAVDFQLVRALVPAAGLVLLAAADREPEPDDRRAAVRQGPRGLRILRQPADQHDLVQRRHLRPPSDPPP